MARLGGFRALVLLLLPQLPLWLAGGMSGPGEPVFNLDLGIASVLICLNRGLGLACLLLAWGVDVAARVAFVYHFEAVHELLASARFAAMPHLGPAVHGTYLLMAFTMACCAVLLWRLPGAGVHRGRLAAACAAVLVLIVGVDVLNGSGRVLDAQDSVRLPFNVAGSPAMNAGYAAWVAHLQAGQPLAPHPDPKAYRAVRAWTADHPRSAVLVVLVESMGRPQAEALGAWMRSRIATPRVLQRWSLQESREAFQGATTHGELRVLCGRVGHYSRLTPTDEADCLPRRLVASGWQATGLHGFDLAFFDRQDWWPRIGLTAWNFNAEPPGRAGGCNVSFPGRCDAQVLRDAARLSDREGAFVYALTLDTHLPMAEGGAVDPGLARLCQRAGTAPMACLEMSRLGEVLDALESQMAQLAHPPLVVITGDHAPPFAEDASRRAFDAQQVPLYILTPHDREPG